MEAVGGKKKNEVAGVMKEVVSKETVRLAIWNIYVKFSEWVL